MDIAVRPVNGARNPAATKKAGQRRPKTNKKKAPQSKKSNNRITQLGLAKSLANLGLGRLSGKDAHLARRYCGLNANEKGFYFKHLDPAGSVETNRAVGACSKIPDGLVTFSVDAEIRVVKNIGVPTFDRSIVDRSERVWSMYLMSYPLFRIAAIFLANMSNLDPNAEILALFCKTLNNLPDYRVVVASENWELLVDDWYYLILALPPTYSLPDPSESNLRTVTDFRLTYKSITVEDNSPTLLNQGFWAGGNYAITPASQPLEAQVGVGSISWASIINTSTVAAQGSYKLVIRNLPPIPVTVLGDAFISLTNDLFFGVQVTATAGGTGAYGFTFIIPEGIVWTQITGTVFAIEGDTITVSRPRGGTFTDVTIASSSSAFVYTLNLGTIGNAVNTVSFKLDSEAIVQTGGTASVVSLPAINTDQIAANNFKMEQFLMKESGGAYLVHKKIRNPVFELTNAREYGPILFSTPGYPMSDNHLDGSGILDTMDRNFSTISAAFKGIAYANNPVVKIYQGWEGLTNVDTPLGQFGHSGLAKNEELLQLIDCITTMTTGVYPARDNFLGAIAAFAAKALKSVFAHEATSSVIRSIGNAAVNVGSRYLTGQINKIGRPRVEQPYLDELD